MSLGVAVRLAQFIEKRLEPRDDPAMMLDLAGPSAFFGVIGELALKAEAFAQPRRVLGSGNELSAGQVEVASARAFLGQAQVSPRGLDHSARPERACTTPHGQAAGTDIHRLRRRGRLHGRRDQA
jgi:hypothetical protein